MRAPIGQRRVAWLGESNSIGAAATGTSPQLRDSCPFADEVDGIQASESREVGLATRELLIERVNRLSAALDRMSEGAYGTCAGCGEAISAARLHAMPEVQTCVRCQDGIERVGRHMDRSRRSVFAAIGDGAIGATSPASIGALHLPNEGDRDVRVPGMLRAAASF